MLQGGFVETLHALKDAEAMHPTYFKTDFHWNGYGGTAAFTPIVNEIINMENPGIQTYGYEDYEI